MKETPTLEYSKLIMIHPKFITIKLHSSPMQHKLKYLLIISTIFFSYLNWSILYDWYLSVHISGVFFFFFCRDVGSFVTSRSLAPSAIASSYALWFSCIIATSSSPTYYLKYFLTRFTLIFTQANTLGKGTIQKPSRGLYVSHVVNQ